MSKSEASSAVRSFDPASEQDEGLMTKIKNFTEASKSPEVQALHKANEQQSEQVIQDEIRQQREADIEDQNFDAHAAVETAFYGDSHIAGPEVKVCAAVNSAVGLNKMEGVADKNIGSGGSLSNKTRADVEKEKNEKSQAAFENFIDNMREQLEDKKREQEEFDKRHDVTQSYAEWSESDQAFGNVHLNGKGWEKLQSWLQKGDNKNKTEAELKKQGYTAQQIADIFRATQIMAKPPSKWTEEEKEFIKEKEKEPEVQAGIEVAKNRAANMGAELSESRNAAVGADDEKSVTETKELWSDNTNTATVDLAKLPTVANNPISAATLIDKSDNLFPNAPKIKPDFIAASNNELPQQLAVNTPAVAPTAIVLASEYSL